MEVKLLYQRRAAFQQSLPRTSVDRSSPMVSNLSSKKEREREKKKLNQGVSLEMMFSTSVSKQVLIHNFSCSLKVHCTCLVKEAQFRMKACTPELIFKQS